MQEVAKQLAQAELELEEYRKQKRVKKAMDKSKAAGVPAEPAEVGPGAIVPAAVAGFDIEKLRQVEQLVSVLQPRAAAATSGSNGASATPAGSDTAAADQQSKAGSSPGAARPAGQSSGPSLPQRKPKAAAVAPATGGADGTAEARSQPAASTSGRSAELVAACSTLQQLLKDDDSACVYLRACDGLQALALQLSSPEMPGLPCAPMLAALNEACMNDGNLALLPPLKVLPACVHALGGGDAAAAAAAAALLCTAATNVAVRQEISKVLGAEEQLVKLIRLLLHAEHVTQVGGQRRMNANKVLALHTRSPACVGHAHGLQCCC